MNSELDNIRNEFFALVMDVDSLEKLEELKTSYFGRKGKINNLLKNMSELKPVERAEFGKLVNETKNILLEGLDEKANQLGEDESFKFDPTIPGKQVEVGHKHILTQAIEEIEDIFKRIGFTRKRYPEVEWDWYAFESLNFAPDHPARDNWETFWVDMPDHEKYGQMLLTPHTSSGQVREMERLNSTPPIRMINVGKTYRRQSDVSHTPMFHQFEGLVVDQGITLKHLIGTLEYFAKSFFGEQTEIRLRPHDFEFTEPSFEIDVSCGVCEGKGCKLCKEGWLELLGAGMVHPNVLKAGGIDPKKYTGFAFGAGVERAAMLQPGVKIDDLRTLYSTDLRYLKQF